jgi:uncharacterized protein
LGGFAWEKAEEVFRKLEGRKPATDTELKEIRHYDPIKKIDEILRRPILFIHGDTDQVVPVEIQRFAVRSLEGCYEHKQDKIKYI